MVKNKPDANKKSMLASKILYDFYIKEGLNKKSFGFGWKNKKEALLKFSIGEKILDVGCAEGLFTQFLSIKEQHKVIVGVEISRPKLLLAKKNTSGSKIAFVNASWNNLPFKTGTFNTVVWFDGIEHCFNPPKSLREIGRITKHRLILSVPTSTPLLLMLEWIETKVNTFMLKTIGEIFRGHLHCFTHSKMKCFLTLNGFTIIQDIHNLSTFSILEQIKRLLYSIRETVTKIHVATTIYNSIFIVTQNHEETIT